MLYIVYFIDTSWGEMSTHDVYDNYEAARTAAVEALERGFGLVEIYEASFENHRLKKGNLAFKRTAEEHWAE